MSASSDRRSRRSGRAGLGEESTTGDRQPTFSRGVPFAARPQGRTWSFTYRVALMLLDSAVILGAVTVAVIVRFEASPLQINGIGFNLIGVAMVVLWLGLLVGTGCYDHRVFGVGADEFKRIFNGTVQMASLIAIVAYLADFPLARSFLVVATPIGLAGLLIERYAARKYLHRLRRDGSWSHRVVIVGDEARARELLRNLTRDRHAGLKVVGACLTGEQHRIEFLRPDVPVVGGPDDIAAAIMRLDADTVAVTTSRYFGSDDLRRLAWSLEGSGVDVIVAPALTDVAGPRIHIRPVAGLPLLHLEEPDYRGGRQLAKAVFDRVSALGLLILLSPLMLAIAAAVRMTSDGPALFRQQRVGRNGNLFTICKFRTMHDGADARFLELVESQTANKGGMFVKNRNDPRITGLGAFLRRFSLDELPQLLNVVRGEMSLVGPRPLPVAVIQDGIDVRRRLLVRPGITGLWQVSGRSELPWEEAVRLDLYYVENWSLSFDLLILWKTVRVAFLGDGAY